MMNDFSVWAVDVGSVRKGNFGFWGMNSRHQPLGYGTDMPELVECVVKDLRSRRRVALGFECPLYLPMYSDPVQLTNARGVDGNRAWSAQAGPSALATGLVEYAWVLQRIRDKVVRDAGVQVIPTFEWERFASGNETLLLWEAFVSGKAKGSKGKRSPKDHVKDAKTAAEAFHRRISNGDSNPNENGKVFSLVAAALLYTGWSDDPKLLHQPCLVVRA